MPLVEIIGDQQRTYSDEKTFCRAQWAKICGVTDYAIKAAIERSGAASQESELNGTPVLVTPVGEFPRVVEGLEKCRKIINGTLIVDRSLDLSVLTPHNSHLLFQRET